MNTYKILRSAVALLVLSAALLVSTNAIAADATTTTEKVSDEIDTLGQKISENRLVNRTPAEIAAWAVAGVLVASLAGLFTPFGGSVSGRFARLGIGLAGAAIGGMVARVAEADFGWAVIQLPLEELLLSFLGAVLLVGIFHLIRWPVKKAGRALTSSGKD